ncbi:MAG: hypothetical protein AABX53_04235 [Nanoarchaeota archaeon]
MRRILLLGFFVLASAIAFASAATNFSATVCCEKTQTGAFCQNVPSEVCASDARQTPTACESTSYCKPGTCYDSNEGTCLDNTPQIVCNANGGIWSSERPAQCELGCCMLGDQAAFVSLVRCKKLSGFLGLKTNYDPSIGNELACIAQVQLQDRGACVYEFEFQKTCTFTTRAECEGSSKSSNGSIQNGVFYKDKLCSAEELGTICGPSRKTMCIPGKDEVYWLDTCGNPANIYDASKWNDKDYWTNVKDKDASCGPLSGNADSKSCGNCNYLLGSFCRSASFTQTRASYGDFICADLNCVDESGKARKHGESWCLSDERRKLPGENSVGSRFFKRICVNGDVITEPCEDFRAEECVEDSIETTYGPFAQAACRVNRWQDCLAQTDRRDCENTDRRDCFWKEGVTLGNTTIDATCLPKNSPGLNFWSGEDSRVVCGVGNKVCVVKFEKDLFGNEKCKDNCECLEPGWESKYGEVCAALGDCGAKVNYEGKRGFKEGIQVKINGKIRES